MTYIPNNKKNLIVLKSSTIRFFFLIILVFLTVGLFYSCKEKQMNREKKLNRKELIAEVKELYFNDQKYRRMLGVFNKDCKSSDSTNIPPVFSGDKETRLAYQVFYKDVRGTQDRKNTKKLIEITEKYGFPGMKHLHHDIPVFLVFVHSDKEDFEKIRNLIKNEFEAGRVSKFEKDYIFWHLNGRNGLTPPIPHPINYRRSVEIFKGVLNDEAKKYKKQNANKSTDCSTIFSGIYIDDGTKSAELYQLS